MGCSVGSIEFRNLLTVTEEKSTEGGRSLIRTARAAQLSLGVGRFRGGGRVGVREDKGSPGESGGGKKGTKKCGLVGLWACVGGQGQAGQRSAVQGGLERERG